MGTHEWNKGVMFVTKKEPGKRSPKHSIKVTEDLERQVVYLDLTQLGYALDWKLALRISEGIAEAAHRVEKHLNEKLIREEQKRQMQLPHVPPKEKENV